MEKDKKQEIALQRYGVIAPLVVGTALEEHGSKMAFYRAAADVPHLSEDGTYRYYSEHSIKNWYRMYKLYGFEGLLPKGRNDAGRSRALNEDQKETIKFIKKEHPRMPATEIYRTMIENGSIRNGEVSESTVSRFVSRLREEEKYAPSGDMRRYERPHINEVWCGDTCYGPYLKEADGKRRRIYFIALIDDASRFIVAANCFYNDNFVNLMSVLKTAVGKYGRPMVLNFDNGSSFKNRQMDLLAARIGSIVHYCRPYSPTEKSKIERWWLTMKNQWLSTLSMEDFKDIDEVRMSLNDYVHRYNTTVHSSLNGQTPEDRFFQEPEYIKRMPEAQMDSAFLLEIERRVSVDCVISIDNVEYEVDTKFAKKRITLRYAPDFSLIYVVEEDGSLSPIRLLNKLENAEIKRNKIYWSEGESYEY